MKVVLGLKIPEPYIPITLTARQSGRTQRNKVIAEIYKKIYGTIKRPYSRIT